MLLTPSIFSRLEGTWGSITLASIEKASDKLRFFSKDNIAVEGYDYVLIMDQKAWELASPADRVRLISHELQHILIDEKDRLKLRDHEITDFYMEIKYNQDDPEWSRKLAVLVDDVYAQEKEEQED